MRDEVAQILEAKRAEIQRLQMQVRLIASVAAWLPEAVKVEDIGEGGCQPIQILLPERVWDAALETYYEAIRYRLPMPLAINHATKVIGLSPRGLEAQIQPSPAIRSLYWMERLGRPYLRWFWFTGPAGVTEVNLPLATLTPPRGVTDLLSPEGLPAIALLSETPLEEAFGPRRTPARVAVQKGTKPSTRKKPTSSSSSSKKTSPRKKGTKRSTRKSS